MLFEKSWPTPLIEDVNEIDLVQAKILNATIDRLETDKDSLLNTISDLRQLIQRIALQQEREAQRRKNYSKELESQIGRLQNAISASEQHSWHFSNVSNYWNEFLE